MVGFVGGAGGSFDYVQDSQPDAPLKGESWYDTDANGGDGELKVYDGSAWNVTGFTSHGDLTGITVDAHHSPVTVDTPLTEDGTQGLDLSIGDGLGDVGGSIAVTLGNGLTIDGSGRVSIPAGAVDTNELADAAVQTAKVDTDAVTTAKVAADAVTKALIAADAVDSAQIANAAVTAARIAADAVTQAKIAPGAVGPGEASLGDGLGGDGSGNIAAQVANGLTIDANGNIAVPTTAALAHGTEVDAPASAHHTAHEHPGDQPAASDITDDGGTVVYDYSAGYVPESQVDISTHAGDANAHHNKPTGTNGSGDISGATDSGVPTDSAVELPLGLNGYFNQVEITNVTLDNINCTVYYADGGTDSQTVNYESSEWIYLDSSRYVVSVGAGSNECYLTGAEPVHTKNHSHGI